ncbi:MAG: tyrosine-type recombinase/integrase [Pseudomonadota bacterium]
MSLLSPFDVVVQPAPMESIVLPAGLSGCAGSNRAQAARAQIAANNDVDAIKAWLARFVDTKTTFDNYRKEAERLLLWCTVERAKPLSSLHHEDWLAYKQFLKDPQPASRWVTPDGRKFARAHPGWRPFAGPLSLASQRQSAVILNALFSWLVNAGYLAGNPLALSRERKRRGPARVTRYVDDDIWTEIKATIDALPRETPKHREHYYRLRWLFTLLYVCGLRISEVIGTDMGAFFQRRDKAGVDRWWLEVLGKGDKLRLVPATGELMAELATYRRQLGMAPLPSTHETAPLLLPIGGKHRRLTRGGVHAIVKQVFIQTAERFRQRGPAWEPDALRALDISAHWLRHTAGSHMANGALDLRHVRDNLGHESISTTNIYLHSPDDLRHAETEEKHRINW